MLMILKHDSLRESISLSFCRQVVEDAVKAFGRIDILVNNASRQVCIEPLTKPETSCIKLDMASLVSLLVP